jgi:hypothetical protein
LFLNLKQSTIVSAGLCQCDLHPIKSNNKNL